MLFTKYGANRINEFELSNQPCIQRIFFVGGGDAKLTACFHMVMEMFKPSTNNLLECLITVADISKINYICPPILLLILTINIYNFLLIVYLLFSVTLGYFTCASGPFPE